MFEVNVGMVCKVWFLKFTGLSMFIDIESS